MGKSMRTVRSKLFQQEHEHPTTCVSDNLNGSLMELASRNNKSSIREEQLLDFSHALSDFSACSSDISGELHRLANVSDTEPAADVDPEAEAEVEAEPCVGFLQRETFSTEIIESISPEDLQPTVKICVDALHSPSVAVKRSAAAKLRLLAKNRADNRAMIGESGAVAGLVELLQCSDPWTQEHAVTALLNVSLLEENREVIKNAGAVKSLIYVLKTGTETSKQNAACALMSLAMVEENKMSIGASGAIPPLVSLVISGSQRGKKDALTTLYKLCSVRQNKERAVSAGAVRPLVELVAEQGSGMADKAMVVLNSLAGIEEGREAIVDEGGICALVEAIQIEDGSVKGKDFALLTLIQLCSHSLTNRELLISEGAIPPLFSLSLNASPPSNHKAHTLVRYLTQSTP